MAWLWREADVTCKRSRNFTRRCDCIRRTSARSECWIRPHAPQVGRREATLNPDSEVGERARPGRCWTCLASSSLARDLVGACGTFLRARGFPRGRRKLRADRSLAVNSDSARPAYLLAAGTGTKRSSSAARYSLGRGPLNSI